MSRTRVRHARRLPAAERREAVLEAATRVFAEGSYSGATTAELARAAGVSEPILYRHFASKRDLYLSVIEASWAGLRAEFDERRRCEGPAAVLFPRPGAPRPAAAQKAVLQTLWIQALSEAGEDPQVRRFMRRHLREVHDYVRDLVEEAQAVGAVAPDRDPEAEAWVFIGGALLLAVANRLGNLLAPEDLDAIVATRRRWLAG